MNIELLIEYKVYRELLIETRNFLISCLDI